ncbi:MAG: hypothetical protein OXD30_09680 [Bryobacterales bacterium]|nr:hypothetical protein [Bryobacterales bacterium]
MSETEIHTARAEIVAICQDHLARLGEEAGQVAEDRLAGLAAKAVAETGALLNQIVAATRRIRDAGDPAAVLAELADSAGRLCERAVVLLKDGDRLTVFRASHAASADGPVETGQASFDLADVSPLAQAVETKDTVLVDGGEHNASRSLGYPDDTGLRAFPIVLRDTVLGLVVVDSGSSQGTAIESLILTAEAWIEALSSRVRN